MSLALLGNANLSSVRWVKSSQGSRRGTCGWITSFFFLYRKKPKGSDFDQPFFKRLGHDHLLFFPFRGRKPIFFTFARKWTKPSFHQMMIGTAKLLLIRIFIDSISFFHIPVF